MTRRSKLFSLAGAISILPFTSACARSVTGNQALAGRWGGVLSNGGNGLRLILEIEVDQPVQLISVDRGNRVIPASSGRLTQRDLDVSFSGVKGRLRAALTDQGTLAGTWDQQGRSRDLVLTKLGADEVPVAPAPTPFGDYQGEVDQARAKSKVPALGAAFAGIKNGQAIGGEVVSGVLVQGETAPVTPGKLWHIGSITKSMTATLVARLVEKGALSWDAKLGDTFGDLAPDMLAAYRNRTLSDLMTGQTGMPTNIKVADMLGHIATDETPTQRRAVWVKQAFAMPPEQGFVYPNNGYVLAGALCEKITGKAYEALMFEEVFKPLGITSAGFGAPALGNPQGHRKALLGGRLVSVGVEEAADNAPPMSPAGRAHMSLADLTKFARAHSDGHNGLRNDYLRQETWQKLHTPMRDDKGIGDYAFGWVVRPDGTLWHNGSNTYWLAELAFDPKTGAAACACASVFDSAEAVGRMLAAGLA